MGLKPAGHGRSVLEGSWPEEDMRRAFVAGAKWWEWKDKKFTMWDSDVNRAEAQAEKRYPEEEQLLFSIRLPEEPPVNIIPRTVLLSAIL